MKTCSVLLLVFLAALTPARAEVRIIVIELARANSERTNAEPALATIYSDVEKERKKDVSVAEAADILKVATGYRSAVLVAIYSRDRIKPEELLPLLTVVPHNPWLMLGPVIVGGEAAEIETWKKSLTSRNEKA